MLAFGPPSGLHAVADDGSEGGDRQVLVRIENEERRAIRGVAHDREGNNRHRFTLTQDLVDRSCCPGGDPS